jgi:hypothetical protein
VTDGSVLLGTVAESSPIVPISAQLKYNIDAVHEYIVKRIPIPIRDFTSDPRLVVIRSFDINKPGAEVEIRPGIVTKDNAGRNICKPIFSEIVSLHAEINHLSFAIPGGLIGAGPRSTRRSAVQIGRWDRYWALSGSFQGVRRYDLFIPAPSRTPPTPPPRTRNQPILASPAPRRSDGRQETNEGVQIDQGRAVTDQHRLDFHGRTRPERQGRPRQDPADLTRIHRGRRKGCAVMTDRETLATLPPSPSPVYYACLSTGRWPHPTGWGSVQRGTVLELDRCGRCIVSNVHVEQRHSLSNKRSCCIHLHLLKEFYLPGRPTPTTVIYTLVPCSFPWSTVVRMDSRKRNDIDDPQIQRAVADQKISVGHPCSYRALNQ